MSATILWVFIVTFPNLMGGPVIIPVANVTQTQCVKVRQILKAQLDSHRSNAAVGECLRSILIVDTAPE